MDYTILTKYNIDYKKGLERCMDDPEFFKTLLSMFLEDDTFNRAQAAFRSRDMSELFKCCHELKGVCGNAAITGLFNAVCSIVELLRNDSGSEAEITELFGKVEYEYSLAIEGISAALGD